MTFDEVLSHVAGADHGEPPHPQPYAPAQPGSLREQMELETARSHAHAELPPSDTCLVLFRTGGRDRA